MAVPEPTQENEKLRNFMMRLLMQYGNPVHDSRTGKLSVVSLQCSTPTAVLASRMGDTPLLSAYMCYNISALLILWQHTCHVHL